MKIRTQYCLDGSFYYSDEFRIDLSNRAFRYGDTVFESMFVVSKTVPLLDKHFARLEKAIAYWQMEMPVLFTKERLAKDIERLCNKNRLFQGARARLSFFRQGGGLYAPETNRGSYLLEVDYFPVQKFTLNEEGYKLGTFRGDFRYPSFQNRFKSGQSFLSVQAGIFKQKEHCDEVLLLSPDFKVVEATAYNIFVLKDEVLYTPPLELGAVAGVMRTAVWECATDCELVVEEKIFDTNFLLDANEIFLTNAVVGIRWVLGYATERYRKRKVVALVEKLNEKYIP